MNRLKAFYNTAAILLSVCLYSPLVGADDYNDGLKAYNAGDYRRSYEIWRPLAENGNAAAQVGIGLLYLYGKGAPLNDQEAVRWFRAAAEQKQPRGQYNLGYMYEIGRGVPQDDNKAIHWFQKSAQQGSKYGMKGLERYANIGQPRAMSELGEIYADGKVVKQDLNHAETLWLTAASKGSWDAKLSLCKLYEENPQKRDLTKAYVWARISELKSSKGGEEFFNIVMTETMITGYTKYVAEEKLTKDQFTRAKKLAKTWEELFQSGLTGVSLKDLRSLTPP